MRLELKVNGRSIERELAPQTLLLDFVRDELGLTGAKRSCEVQVCGTCTVLVDGRPILSCLALPVECEGREITTVEGLAARAALHPLQQAFAELGSAQCGYCIPGFLLSAAALLRERPHPTRTEIAEATAGNLCRCTGYLKIFEAIELAAERMRPSEAETVRG